MPLVVPALEGAGDPGAGRGRDLVALCGCALPFIRADSFAGSRPTPHASARHALPPGVRSEHLQRIRPQSIRIVAATPVDRVECFTAIDAAMYWQACTRSAGTVL